MVPCMGLYVLQGLAAYAYRTLVRHHLAQFGDAGNAARTGLVRSRTGLVRSRRGRSGTDGRILRTVQVDYVFGESYVGRTTRFEGYRVLEEMLQHVENCLEP